MRAFIKDQTKKFLNKVAPDILAMKTSLRMRRDNKKAFWSRQCDLVDMLYPDRNILVLSGPFRGMKYINEVVWGPIEPKWLGTYEQELHPIITDIITERYDTVVDIGSAEGYYSVGMAVAMPTANVHSYEIDPLSRFQQARLAKLNKVTNLNIHRYCRHQDIDHVFSGRTLLICDVEGFELELLNPEKSKQLRYIDVLVELHNTKNLSLDEMESEMKSRFQESHRISSIIAEPREIAPQLPFYVHSCNYAEVMNEHRMTGQIWLWMQVGHRAGLQN